MATIRKRGSRYINDLCGARGRTRTGMELPPRDFKSLASTSFATRARQIFVVF